MVHFCSKASDRIYERSLRYLNKVIKVHFINHSIMHGMLNVTGKMHETGRE